jgi:hypothetical protein
MMDDSEKQIPNLKDRTLVCVDCDTPFTWSKGEQLFYIAKGLIPPKRCLKCRTFRKLTIDPRGGTNNV